MRKLLASMLGLSMAFVAFANEPQQKDAKKEPAKFDAEKLIGPWKITGGKKAGTAVGDDAKKSAVTFTKDTITMAVGEGKFVFKYSVNAKVSPVAIDLEITDGPVGKGEKAQGIIELADGKLKLCYPGTGGDRPTKFDDEKFFLFIMEKQKDEKK